MLTDPTSPEAIKNDVNVVPMNFRKEFRQKGENFEEFHAVDLVKKGSNGESTPWKISQLKQDAVLWPAIRPYYEAWLEGEETPVDGTPIDVLPFVPKTLVPHLKDMHIRTAEDFIQANDATLQRIGMGARRMQEMCKTYVGNLGDASTAERMTTLENENASLRKQLEALQDRMDELSDVEPPEGVQRRRGRPRKAA